jgi:hypothetical protein
MALLWSLVWMPWCESAFICWIFRAHHASRQDASTSSGESRSESGESHVRLAFAPVMHGPIIALRHMRRLVMVAIGGGTMALLVPTPGPDDPAIGIKNTRETALADA